MVGGGRRLGGARRRRLPRLRRVRACARRLGGGGVALCIACGDAAVHYAHAKAARAAQAAPRWPARVADAAAVVGVAGAGRELGSEAEERQR